MAIAATAIEQVIDLAQFCTQKGWLPATSGNLSVKVDEKPLQFAITRSGVDKQRLAERDVLLVDGQMHVLNSEIFKPSAETNVHVAVYDKLECGSILHIHTVYNNLVSEIHGDIGYVTLENHELLKALGHWEVNASIRLPIVENFHDLTELASAVGEVASDQVPGVLVRNHGIYAWGSSADEARRHLEAFEFLFEYTVKLSSFRATSGLPRT